MAVLDTGLPFQTEVGHCQRCGSVVAFETDGPFGYGRVFERCTNQRCVDATPHACRPDLTGRAPKGPPVSRTPECARLRNARARGLRVDREAPVFGIRSDYSILC
jgi:hypothetical protein